MSGRIPVETKDEFRLVFNSDSNQFELVVRVEKGDLDIYSRKTQLRNHNLWMKTAKHKLSKLNDWPMFDVKEWQLFHVDDELVYLRGELRWLVK